jgi:hypothetical protein
VASPFIHLVNNNYVKIMIFKGIGIICIIYARIAVASHSRVLGFFL